MEAKACLLLSSRAQHPAASLSTAPYACRTQESCGGREAAPVGKPQVPRVPGPREPTMAKHLPSRQPKLERGSGCVKVGTGRTRFSEKSNKRSSRQAGLPALCSPHKLSTVSVIMNLAHLQEFTSHSPIHKDPGRRNSPKLQDSSGSLICDLDGSYTNGHQATRAEKTLPQ